MPDRARPAVSSARGNDPTAPRPGAVSPAAADEPADAPARDGATDAAPSSANGTTAPVAGAASARSSRTAGRGDGNDRGRRAGDGKTVRRPRSLETAKAKAAGKSALRDPPPGPPLAATRDEPTSRPADPRHPPPGRRGAARLLGSDGAMAYLLDETSGILRFATDAGITDDQQREWVARCASTSAWGCSARPSPATRSS
jgi:hypothetical protein